MSNFSNHMIVVIITVHCLCGATCYQPCLVELLAQIVRLHNYYFCLLRMIRNIASRNASSYFLFKLSFIIIVPCSHIFKCQLLYKYRHVTFRDSKRAQLHSTKNVINNIFITVIITFLICWLTVANVSQCWIFLTDFGFLQGDFVKTWFMLFVSY